MTDEKNFQLEEEEELELITMEFEDENGETYEVEYSVGGFTEVNGQEYIILVETEDDTNLAFFRYSENEDETADITPIEDDEEFKAVLEVLRAEGLTIEMDEEI